MNGRLDLVYRLFVSLSILLIVCAPYVVSQPFSLSFSSPAECDGMNVSWFGGSAPFELYLTPMYGTPRNISIPSSAVSNGQGSYEVQLPFRQGQQMILSMFDATGVPSGGVSDLLTVGRNVGGNSCNTTDPGVDFFYELNTQLVQCEAYDFSAYTNAIQPVTIMGMVPARDPIILHPPVGPTSFNWTANMTAGTSVIFVMTDSQGRQGGASNLLTIGYSANSSCIGDSSSSSSSSSSYSSTANPASKTSSASPGERSIPGKAALSGGAIAGIVIGSLVAVTAIGLIVFVFLRRKRVVGRRRPRSLSFDLVDPMPRMSQLTPGLYEATPFPLPTQHPDSAAHTMSASERPSFNAYDDNASRYLSPTSSSRARKVSEAPSSSHNSTSNHTYSTSHPSRGVVHRDAEDVVSDEGYFDLPPEYRESRRPLPGLPNSSTEGGTVG